MDWNKVAEHVYIINLQRRNDRKLLMEYKLKKINMNNYEFFDATDGYDAEYDSLYNKVKNQFNSRGSLGLILTYIRLLEDACQKNYASILILEDDINVHKNYKSLLSMFNKVISKKRHDILWLGANQPKISDKQLKDIKKRNRYRPEPKNQNYTYGTYSMIITHNGIAMLAEYVNDKNITNLKPIDNFINDLMKTNKIHGSVCYPYLFIPDVSDSDNMPVRNQNEFANIRGIDMKDYEYVSQHDIKLLKDFVKSQQLIFSGKSIIDILYDIGATEKSTDILPKVNFVLDNNDVSHVLSRIMNVITNNDDIIKLIQ